MKTWIKRSLIGVVGATLVFAGIAAYSHSDRHGMRWQVISEQDAAGFKAGIIEHAARKLDLDEAQKVQLGVLADRLRAQRNALVSAGPDPRTEMQALIAGPAFDRARAEGWVTTMTDVLRTGSPNVIAAAADFYDSLRPEQQEELRTMMQHRGGRHGHRWHERERS